MPESHVAQKYSASRGLRLATESSCAVCAAMVVTSTCFSTYIRYRCSTLFLFCLCVTATKPSRAPAEALHVSPSTACVDEYSRMKGMESSR